MTRYAEWCAQAEPPVPKHKLRVLQADPTKHAAAVAAIAAAIPDHYVPPARLAGLLARLGRPAVAEFVAQKLPTATSIQSGDLGEILCTTYIHETTPFKLGIKRLRWKDHRNMAMRGDDVLAFELGQGAATLKVLKAESKSRAKMPASVVKDARAALSEFGELPSPHALSFVADRLSESGDKLLKDALDDAQLKTGLKLSQVTHMLFSFSGNDATSILSKNLGEYTGQVAQHYVGLHVEGQRAFIDAVFAAVKT